MTIGAENLYSEYKGNVVALALDVLRGKLQPHRFVDELRGGVMKWTCEGSVRGSCGINHRSHDAAMKCCERDHASIRRAYPSTFPTRAYSDRHPVPGSRGPGGPSRGPSGQTPERNSPPLSERSIAG